MKKLIAFVLGIFNSPSFTAALHQQRREKKGGTGRAGGAVFALASLLVFLFSAPSMAGNVPNGYTELEYIQSTGTQYIDTGVVPTDAMGFSIVLQSDSVTQDNVAIGSRENTGDTRFWIDVDFSGGKNGLVLFGWNNFHSVNRVIGTNKKTISMNFQNSRRCVIDGDIVDSISETLATQTKPMYLFSANGASQTYNFKGKIYSVVISEGANIIANFIPAKDSRGTVGMYDTVSGQFFTNAGTGNFTAGRELDGCRNLFNKNDSNMVLKGWLVNTSTGQISNVSNNLASFVVPVKPNTTYSIQRYTTGASPHDRFAACTTSEYPQQGTSCTILGNVVDHNVRTATYTTPADAHYLFVYGVNTTTNAEIQNAKDAFMVEQGDTATNYVPYSAACHPTSCKNLFNSTLEQGTIGGTGVTAGAQNRIRTKDFIDVDPNTTYTLSAKITDKIKTAMVFLYQSDGTFIDFGRSNTYENMPYTFTTTANTAKIKAVFTGVAATSGALEPSDVQEAQLEAGSTATAYTPYSASCGTCTGNLATYDSATGTVVQNGTPTPTNPIYPIFYTQGKITLRRVGDVADSYDASTGKITRRVGYKVLNGTEDWLDQLSGYGRVYLRISNILNASIDKTVYCSHAPYINAGNDNSWHVTLITGGLFAFWGNQSPLTSLDAFKTWLADQAANGTPVTIYYPLATATEETVGKTWCETAIKIATTKYNTNAFSSVVTALSNAVDTIKTVVANTINQATAVANLHSGKQTMPDSTATNGTCPNYKQCLLVEDESGTPHWYVITDPFRDFVTPILANSTAANSITNDAGYTQLEYITGNGDAYIDLNTALTQDDDIEIKFKLSEKNQERQIFGGRDSSNTQNISMFSGGTLYMDFNNSSFSQYRLTLVPNVDKIYIATINKTQRKLEELNGEVIGTATNICEDTITTSGTYLFHIAGNPVNQNKFNGSIYSVKIGNRMNLVPVRRNSDGKYGMYDKAATGNQQVFYPNSASSGDDFIPGPEVINQDPAIPGMTWTATWNGGNGVTAGTVSGVARCAPVAGTNVATTANPTKYSQLSSANQTAWNVAFNSTTLSNYKYCWCKITGISSSGENIDPMGVTEWVYDTNAASSVCANQCSRYCAYYVKQGSEGIGFRKALFGQ